MCFFRISTTQKKRITKSTMRLPRNRAATYRELQVLLSTVNYTFAYVLPGHKLLFMLLTIRAVYMMVKFPGLPRLLGILLVAALGTYLGLIFTFLARFYEYSRETLFSWRSPQAGQDQWSLKCRRSFRPMKVEIGGFYYVDFGIVLTMFSIIIDYSVNLLLTYV